MPLQDLLLHARQKVLPVLSDTVSAMPDPIGRIIGYHFGFVDAEGQPSHGSPGKLLRPALVLECARGVAGQSDKAIPAAAAVEMIHGFSLLHDDIIDRDRTRRHRPTAWVVFGADQALLAGDALLAKAHEVFLFAQPAPPRASVDVFRAAIQSLVLGEAQDVQYARARHCTVEEYEEMALRKTGSLLGAACAVGAFAAGADEQQARAMQRFGEQLGLAFQIRDDILGTYGDPAVTGKPVGGDLMHRKKSYCLLHALTGEGAVHDHLRRLYACRAEITEREAADMVRALRNSGGEEAATRAVAAHMDQAVRHLEASGLPPESVRRLVGSAREIAGLAA
ncbi:polyprenyl synthetase family protein [Streptomyces cellulosae]|uniref:Polyprenyl synthetase family protein n=1 Tax=Streptomyces cellulosae TaxID=1968 RepID=A0ABW6JDE6_STRCE